MSPFTGGWKRLIDVVLSLALLVVLAPVIVLVGVAVRLRLGRPVIFRQTRPGLHGEPFDILKFRTMTDERGPDGRPLPDGERLPAFGRWLRATSLDELPELWNVLRGDMSLVGPRPLLMEYLERYTPEQHRRHDVRPGITGLAAVSGRNAISWEERHALDVWYVDHLSFWLDVRIMARTVLAVMTGRGVRQDGHATAAPFRPNDHADDPAAGS